MNNMMSLVVAGFMLVGSIVAQLGDPYVNFDCNRIPSAPTHGAPHNFWVPLTWSPDVCNNMCYGAYCSDYGDGAVGVALTYDDPSDQVDETRRNEACGNVACTAE